jgi:hypothetical protein
MTLISMEPVLSSPPIDSRKVEIPAEQNMKEPPFIS